MILDVPYQPQREMEKEGESKWCGLASLWMVLSYYLKGQAPAPQELVEKYGDGFEKNGFRHQDLLKIARDYGLQGFRKSWWAEPGVQPLLQKFRDEGESEEEIGEWLKTNLEEGVFTIRKMIEEGKPVMVSMNPEFIGTQTSHLVVVVGFDGNQLIIHDPAVKGPNYKISEADFSKYWLRQGIILYI